MSWEVRQGDCIEQMRGFEADSIDAIVTDPPYALNFMGKAWDTAGVAFDPATWTEALRVLKPGGHLLAFGGTRTYHRLTCAIEDAGFEVRDCLAWLCGSGFPKSLDVSKAIDKAAGAEGTYGEPKSAAHAGWVERGRMRGGEGHEGYQRPWMQDEGAVDRAAPRYEPATDDARAFAGWGTALKPAFEPVVLARKPLTGTVAGNVLAHGTGALNVDGCRIAGPKGDGNWKGRTDRKRGEDFTGFEGGWNDETPGEQNASGRWPANVILNPEAARLLDQQAPNTGGGGFCGGGIGNGAIYGDPGSGQTRRTGRVDPNGGASRFFYVAKASSGERNAGLADRNPHPTVKPIELMRWLVRLITPPGGTVLDPFCGSGSTGCAAVLEDFDFVGIEREAEYVEVAEARIAHWAAQPKQLVLGGAA